MDYETILQQIGDFGTYQKRLLLVVFFPVLFNSFSTPISNFLVGDHKHRCKIPDVPNDTFAIQDSNHSLLVNISIPILDDGNYDPCHIIVNGSKTTCDAWVFDYSIFTNTINSQFNLVCEKKLSNSHAIATYFFGQVTAPLLVIPLADVCKIPSYPNDTYAIQDSSHAALVNSTIPLTEDGTYDQCHVMVNSSKITCDDWVFDYSVFTNTINSQFKLVCERKLANPHAIVTYFIGQMTSPFLMIPLADIIGRRLVACISLTLIFVVNIAMPFSNSVYMFAVMRYFDGFFGTALYTTAFVIGIELLGASKRLIAGTVILLVFCAGEFILVFLAYFIRDWRWLQLAVAIPMLVPIVYWWPKILPESVRWLISRGRMDEALVILRQAAQVNKTSLPSDIKITYNNEETSSFQILKHLFSSRKLLLYWAIAALNWFVIAFIYYGIKTNIGKLGGDLYVSFTLIVIAETLGYSLLFFMDLIGHKRLHMVAMGTTCVVCVASIFPILFGGEDLQWMTVAFALLGKMSVSTAFGMVYVYTGEIFPTVVRSFAIGSCAVFARIGSLSAPYLYYMTEGIMNRALPLILYGVIISLVTLLTLILPETKGKKLPDHVKESENSDGVLDRHVEETGQE